MYSVGLLLTEVPARLGGRLLSSGRSVVALDATDLAGTTVDGALELPEDRREAWERVSDAERAEDPARELERPETRDSVSA